MISLVQLVAEGSHVLVQQEGCQASLQSIWRLTTNICAAALCESCSRRSLRRGTLLH